MKRSIIAVLASIMMLSGTSTYAWAEETPEPEVEEEFSSENFDNSGEKETVEEETTETQLIEDDLVKEEIEEETYQTTESTAYAVLDASGTLTFFRSEETYDNETEGSFKDVDGNEYTGTVYTNFEKNGATWAFTPPWYSRCQDICKVIFTEGQTIHPESMYNWFCDCSNLEEFDWSGLDTSNTVSMFGLFQNCTSLLSLDLSSFDTENVTNMSVMFYRCENLENVDLSSFHTENVKNMMQMFCGCKSLAVLDLYSFDTKNVTDMCNMFMDCQKLKKLDVSSFDTSNVTNMKGMFDSCKQLESIDASSFDTRNVENMRDMFGNCWEVKSIDVSSFDTSKVTDMSSMFAQERKLEKLDLSNFNTSSVTKMNHMFYGCFIIESLDLGSFNTKQVTDYYGMFWACNNLRYLNIANFETDNAENMQMLFSGDDFLDEVFLGLGMTKWRGESYLPEGTWVNERTGESLTEKELYEKYTDNPEKYYGVWKREVIHVTGVEINKKPQYIRGDENLQLDLTVTPENAVKTTVRYTTENPDVIAVPNGARYIRGQKAGKTKVTVITDDGGFEDTCEVYVMFNDVSSPSQYYFEAVYWALDNNITQGTGPLIFNPGGFCKRYQFVLFLWRQAGCPEPTETEDSFKDVLSDPKKDVYEKAVLWAVDKEITTGTTPTTFDPYAPLTRGQVVTFLYRAAGKPEVSTTTNPFKDLDSSKYYYTPVLWAVENNITTGLNKTQFGPTNTCTRGQTVLFMYRLFK